MLVVERTRYNGILHDRSEILTIVSHTLLQHLEVQLIDRYDESARRVRVWSGNEHADAPIAEREQKRRC